jgi:hypothetical protein
VSFLPQDDQQFLAAKELIFQEREERLPDGNLRRAVVFPDFAFQGSLHSRLDPSQPQLLVPQIKCRLAIIIPSGYATSKLDSFYTAPRLLRSDGSDPDRANGAVEMFGESWQFWSRHLSDTEWRPGIDGLETYLQHIYDELKRA